jgi:hypothetical protein
MFTGVFLLTRCAAAAGQRGADAAVAAAKLEEVSEFELACEEEGGGRIGTGVVGPGTGLGGRRAGRAGQR